jgi:hypothetical protein
MCEVEYSKFLIFIKENELIKILFTKEFDVDFCC